MALKVAFAAKNSFALTRAKNHFVAEHVRDIVSVFGVSDACMIRMSDGSSIYLLTESDYFLNRVMHQTFDQVFEVGGEPLGIDFKLFLQECLSCSCVPEEYQWQKWEGDGTNA